MVVFHRGFNQLPRRIQVFKGALDYIFSLCIRSIRFLTSSFGHFYAHGEILNPPLLDKNAAIININRLVGAALSWIQLHLESGHPEVILQPPIGTKLRNRRGKGVLGGI